MLHRAAYAALGLDARYDALDVGRGGLGELLSALGPEWLGLSVTMPLKQEVLRLATVVDPLATRVGAANTLVPVSGGWRALTTDVLGLVEVLRPYVRVTVQYEGSVTDGDETIVVLGAGATARAALVALDLLGGIASPVVIAAREVGRTPTSAELALSYAVQVVAFDDGRLGEHLARADLIINATPSGAADPLATMLPPALRGTYVDVVYDPWPTALAAAWRKRGGEIVGGLEVLVAQAVLQVEAMTGRRAPVAAMRAAIGLPGERGGPAASSEPVDDGSGDPPARP